MKKVVFIHVGEPIASDAGFVQTRYAAVAAELLRRGHNPIRIAPSFIHRSRTFRAAGEFRDAHLGKFIVVPTCGYANSRSPNRLRSIAQFRSGVLKAIRDERPDIIVVAINPPGFAAKVRKLIGPGARIVVDVRDVFPDAQIATSTGSLRKLLRLFLPYFRRKARADFSASDAIVALSNSYITWVTDMIGLATRETKVIPLGVPTRPASIAPILDRAGVVYIGSLSQILDFELLFDAWKIVEETAPEMAQRHPLQIAGAGPMEAYVMQRAAELSHVHFLGFVDQERAIAIMAQARVGVAPYAKGEFHTMPNKLFDYLSAGLPIVATLGGEAKALISENTLGFAHDDADADWFADGLLELLRRDDLWNEAAEATDHVILKYDRDNLAKEYCDFLDEVVDVSSSK